VLKSVEKYLPYFKGKVVITADHGELLGEKGLYLHGAREKKRVMPPYPKWAADFLKVVPWLVLDR
jgi:glucan phosphoethanolaminetransferase (alkaline phosphatase superfamily)